MLDAAFVLLALDLELVVDVDPIPGDCEAIAAHADGLAVPVPT